MPVAVADQTSVTTWCVSDGALRVWRDGSLIEAIPVAQFPALIESLAREMREGDSGPLKHFRFSKGREQVE
jgi:hypothetical protein